MQKLPPKNKFSFEKAFCTICGSDNAKLRHKVKKFDQGDLTFVTCLKCKTVYQDPRPDWDSMQAFYTTENFFKATTEDVKFVGYIDYDAEEITRLKNAEYRLREVESLYEPGYKLKILKIACGYGAFIKKAIDSGHDAKGIDFSEVMVKGAFERYGINLIHSDILDHDFGDEKFDVIILYGAINNFLEPVKVGSKIFSLLKPGGHYLTNYVEPDSIIEFVQKDKFWLYRPPIIGLWTTKSFVSAHSEFGFKLVRSFKDIQWATIGKLIDYLQIKPLMKFIRLIRIDSILIKLPTPGYTKAIFRRPL
ncbi:MAG: class I SAM-dependent methyltransferase [Pseudomonadota bacterium]|nr:class I SAM-dependent methyltransferase [Pseudomonadota bacterium]